jgi:hemerythrin-like domain-containing protein
LLELHGELDEIFWLHQESLVTLRLELSAELLAAYERLLRVHMRHEEELLLPVFERAGPVPRWPAVLYTGQHEKMLTLLSSVREALSELRRREQNRLRGGIALVTFEATYKHLVEHHDGAEREGLFPIVDRTATPDEATRLLELCRTQWADALAAERELLRSARDALSAGR